MIKNGKHACLQGFAVKKKAGKNIENIFMQCRIRLK
jgi:hypothetical protein